MTGADAQVVGAQRPIAAQQARALDRVAQLAHGAIHEDAIQRLKARITDIPNVKKDPAPLVEILEFNLAGPVLAVRPFCHTDHYWDVYFATNKIIREELSKAEFPVPAKQLTITQLKAS